MIDDILFWTLTICAVVMYPLSWIHGYYTGKLKVRGECIKDLEKILKHQKEFHDSFTVRCIRKQKQND